MRNADAWKTGGMAYSLGCRAVSHRQTANTWQGRKACPQRRSAHPIQFQKSPMPYDESHSHIHPPPSWTLQGLPWQIVLRFLSQQLIPIHLSVIMTPPPLNLLTLFFVLQPFSFQSLFFSSFFIFIFNHLHRFFSLADGGMCYRSLSLFLLCINRSNDECSYSQVHNRTFAPPL